MYSYILASFLAVVVPDVAGTSRSSVPYLTSGVLPSSLRHFGLGVYIITVSLPVGAPSHTDIISGATMVSLFGTHKASLPSCFGAKAAHRLEGGGGI